MATADAMKLKLVNTRSLENGALILTYQPARSRDA
jgi:hypothetical protein